MWGFPLERTEITDAELEAKTQEVGLRDGQALMAKGLGRSLLAVIAMERRAFEYIGGVFTVELRLKSNIWWSDSVRLLLFSGN